MSIYIEYSEVVSNQKIAEDIFFLKVKNFNIARAVTPGQFCNIKVNDYSAPLLRRPLSIAFAKDGIVGFIYDVVGAGTKILSELGEGDSISVEGPLGNGFSFNRNTDIAILLGGGIGIAPLPFLREWLSKNGINTMLFWGARVSSKLNLSLFDDVYYATEDGSEGFAGNVIENIRNIWSSVQKPNITAYACGPTPMLKSAAEFFNEKNVELQISTESRMACGIGICQGCPIKSADSEGYKLVCKEGPVFNSKEVIL
jgi:dihydroorotate dehydrogenase electron transfer subunit